MPDEKGNSKIDEEQVPETSLHAHGSGHEDTGVDAQDQQGDEAKGETHEGEPDASDVPNTGGSTSGGPGGAAQGEEDPSQA
jgi:hypothetical protein